MDQSGQTTSDTLDFTEYLAIIRRRRLLIVAVTLLASIIGFVGMSLRKPAAISYVATTELIPPRFSSAASSTSAETEADLIRSDRIAAIARDLMGVDIPRSEIDESLTVISTDRTEIITIEYRSADPERARLGSESFAEAYLTGREAELEAERQGRLDRVEIEITRITDQLSELTSTVSSSLEGSATQENATALIAVLQNQLTRLRTEASLTSVEPIESGLVVRSTEVDEVRSKGIPPFALSAAIISFSLLLGIGAAFAVDRSSPFVRSTSDAARATGANVLGEVRYTDVALTGKVMPVEFMRAATAAQSAAMQAGQRTLVFAPMMSAADHSRAIDNIAIAHSMSGRKTVVISLSGTAQKPDLDDRVEVVDLPPRPREGSSSGWMKDVLATAHDFVDQSAGLAIIKSPPPLTSPEAFDAALTAGALVLVIRVNRTRRDDLQAALALAANSGIPRCWVVVERRPTPTDKLRAVTMRARRTQEPAAK